MGTQDRAQNPGVASQALPKLGSRPRGRAISWWHRNSDICSYRDCSYRDGLRVPATIVRRDDIKRLSLPKFAEHVCARSHSP